MSHFYGTLQGTRGEATRCGAKKDGMRATAAGWHGSVTVCAYHAADEGGVDRFIVTLGPWQGSGGYSRELARGELRASQTPAKATLNDSAAERERMIGALRGMVTAYLGATGAIGASPVAEARAVLKGAGAPFAWGSVDDGKKESRV